MNRRRAAILIASILIIVTAAGVAVLRLGRFTHGCPLVGCDNAVTFALTSLPSDTLAAAKAATVCANDRCENVPITAGQLWVRVTIGERTVRSASIRMTDKDGNDLVNLKLNNPEEAIEVQPNGPDCEPTCWLLNLIPKDGALEPSPQQYGQPPTSR